MRSSSGDNPIIIPKNLDWYISPSIYAIIEIALVSFLIGAKTLKVLSINYQRNRYHRFYLLSSLGMVIVLINIINCAFHNQEKTFNADLFLKPLFFILYK